MKSLLSPLIVIFNNLQFAVKFGIVIAIFMMPILFLGGMVLNDSFRDVATNELQTNGLHYLKPLRQLSEHTAQHRGMTNAYLSGAKGFKEKILAKRRTIEEDYNALIQLDHSLSEQQGLSKTDNLKQRWQLLSSQAFSMTAKESFSAHTQLIAETLAYMQEIADATMLSTEPELELHYINIALVERLPAQVETLGQTRGFGSGRAAEKNLSAGQRLHLTSLISNIQSTNKHLETGLKIAFKGNETIRQGLQNIAEEAKQASADFVSLSNSELITASQIEIDSKQYFEAGSQAITANLALYDGMIAVTSTLLIQRLEAARSFQTTVIIALTSIFLLLIYVFMALFISLRDNIALIAKGVAQLAEGDFNTLPKLNTQDELKHIGQSLNHLRISVAKRVLGVLSSTELLVQQSKEMMDVSKQARVSVELQKNEVGNVSNSVSQMTSAIQEVSMTTAEAANAANRANQSAVSGTQTVQIMINNIQSLSNEVGEASNVIQQLEQDSNDISKILDVIRDIADQTNLLALNAAIEAARAGEQGRGFAVVADEVRTLAGRTQEATLEIQKMIEQLQKGSQSATQVMLKSGKSALQTLEQANSTGTVFSEIAGHVDHIDGVTNQIASASEQQSAMANEINGNVNSITQHADDGATVGFKNFIASNKVSSLAMEVKTLLNTFVIDEADINASKLSTTEPLFVWSETYSVGVTEVDRQHKILIQLINDLHQGIADNNGEHAIKKSLEALVQYTVSHFAFEEEMFDHTNYPDVVAHKAKHEKLLGQVTGFVRRVESGADETVYNELLSFLTDWLVNHIQGSDKQYAPHLNQHGIR